MGKREVEEDQHCIEVGGLHFAYGGQPPFIINFNLRLPKGSRQILVGANGSGDEEDFPERGGTDAKGVAAVMCGCVAPTETDLVAPATPTLRHFTSGKTTLLKILAGKHMVGGKDIVQVLGRSTFHDTSLVCSGELAYLGGSWSKTVGCSGDIPLQGDFSAKDMIFGVEGVDPARREKLIELLDIDLCWRMHKVSDGQRRRVQICMGILHPFKVLLLDEVTVDLDVVARLDLLDFFREECEQRCATVVYATHIFDGLESWATHIAYIQDGKLKRFEKISKLDEMKNARNMFQVVESWLRAESKDNDRKITLPVNQTHLSDVSPFTSSRHMAYYR